jgi:hypothetical protein
MGNMTLNEALKTRALLAKRIQHAERRLIENCAHTSLTKPTLGEEQSEILKRTLQSVTDLREYQTRLHAAIAKANLETPVEVKGLGSISLHAALEIRGHSKRQGGLLHSEMGLWENLQRSIQHANMEAEQTARSLPKETRDVSVITHVDPKKVESEIARLTQLRHDLDVAIEATNFTTEVELEALPPEEAL